MILNQAQAEAVYSAMCALKDSGNSYLRVCFDAPHGMRIAASSMIYGVIVSLHGEFDDPTSRAKEEELYYSQSAFATAYGLNSGAAPAVCSECGGRGEVETGIGMMTCTSCPA